MIKLPPPILVQCMGRSGSSMVTGVLNICGAWVGDCLKGGAANPKGFFENIRIKREIEARTPMLRLNKVWTPQDGFRGFVEAVLKQEGHDGQQPWAVKHSAVFWKLWAEFETPVFVLPRRDTQAIMSSVRKAGMLGHMDDDLLRAVVELHQSQLDYLRDVKGGVEVDTEAVIRGDLSTLKAAVARCGLSWDAEAVTRFIDPNLWHFRQKLDGND